MYAFISDILFFPFMYWLYGKDLLSEFSKFMPAGSEEYAEENPRPRPRPSRKVCLCIDSLSLCFFASISLSHSPYHILWSNQARFPVPFFLFFFPTQFRSPPSHSAKEKRKQTSRKDTPSVPDATAGSIAESLRDSQAHQPDSVHPLIQFLRESKHRLHETGRGKVRKHAFSLFIFIFIIFIYLFLFLFFTIYAIYLPRETKFLGMFCSLYPLSFFLLPFLLLLSFSFYVYNSSWFQSSYGSLVRLLEEFVAKSIELEEFGAHSLPLQIALTEELQNRVEEIIADFPSAVQLFSTIIEKPYCFVGILLLYILSLLPFVE